MSRLTNTDLRDFGVIPVIRVDSAEQILPLVDTLADNGLPVAEITFRSSCALDAIEIVASQRPEIHLLAGTVLTTEQARRARDAGAEFVVSPGFNPTIVDYCRASGISNIPGVMTPGEIEQAIMRGINTVKFFPAEACGGVPFLKALSGPYPNLNIMPTGGITPANLCDYLALPQVLCCGGSWMVSEQLVQSKNWQEIGRLTKQAKELIPTR